MWQATLWCVGILCGVTATQWWSQFESLLWLVAAGAVCAISFKISRRWVLTLMFLSGMTVGLWRGSGSQHDITIYKTMYGNHVRFSGVIADDPDTNKQGDLTLLVRDVINNDRPVGGELWVTTANRPGLQRGDHITFDGKLSAGFGSMAASMKQATVTSVEREQPGDVAVSVRNDFAQHVEKSIDGAAASLGIGYLLGEKRGLPDELVTALKVAGLTHIVVASGYNLTVLVRLARRLFEKVSKFLSMFSSVVMIGGFMAITGLSPSMTRAGLVSLLALWAWYYGRAFHPITLLSLAGAVTVLVNPSYAWGNLGWELSFAAFAGVMILAPLIHAYFYGNDKPHWIPQLLIETVSAQLTTLPIILVAFGQLSNVAPLANLMIVPLVPFAMALVFAAGIGAYLVPSLAHVIAWPAQVLLDAMIAVVHWCANLSWAQSTIKLEWWGAVLWYLLLTAACLYLWRITRYRFHHSSIVE